MISTLTAIRVTRPKAEEKFKEVKEAYEMPPTPRSVRPMTNSAMPASTRTWVAAGGAGFGGFADAFGDIFGDIFGQVAAAVVVAVALRSTVAATCRTPWKSPLEEGCWQDTQIRIPAWDECETYSSGAKPGTSAKTCSTCNGSGHGSTCARTFSACSKPVRTAAARARSFLTPAMACHGKDKIKKTKTLVEISAGINEGMRIRSAGNGEPVLPAVPLATSTSRSASNARDFRARWRRPALHRARAADLCCIG